MPVEPDKISLENDRTMRCGAARRPHAVKRIGSRTWDFNDARIQTALPVVCVSPSCVRGGS